MRRIASPLLILPDGQVLRQQVVEILQGRVECYYPLTEELPFTEWFDRSVVLRYNEDNLCQAFCDDAPIE